MISRSNMRRQLQANGGIMNARQGYGIGSFVKEKIRKLIPNELADIAVKAAPFVAPFQPGIAAAMRGIGRFDQRGSISDALKQAGGTYAFGKGARYLGGVDASLMPGQGTVGNQYSMAKLRGGPIGNFVPGKEGPGKLADVRQGTSGAPGGGDKTMFSNKSSRTAIDKAIDTSAAKTPGFMKTATEATVGKIPGLRALPEKVQQQLLVGTITGGAEALYNYLAGEVDKEEGESVDEYMARRKIVVGKQMRTYMDSYYTPLTNPEYAKLNDRQKDQFVGRYNVNQGGLMRTGYANGSEDFQNYLKGRKKFESEMNLEQLYREFQEYKRRQKIKKQKTMAADGGLMRLNYMIGGKAKQLEAGAPPIMYSGNMDPNAQAGIPSTPGPMQMAEDGPEFDMRENGGFQPLGRQEGKDDVPAMLAKNEFVMTADAVRAAGGGSIQKGAQKMYNTMKKLESRVS